MKQILLFSLILGQSLSLAAMQKPAQPKSAESRASYFEVLPKEIQNLVFKFITGDTLDQAIEGIRKFYAAYPKGRESVDTMKAILTHIMNTFGFDGASLHDVVTKLSKLENIPVFKNPEMQKWIDQQNNLIYGEYELKEAVRLGDLKKVRELIERGVETNKPKRFGTPLEVAISGNHLDVAKYLIDHGADVNFVNLSRTPLFVAVHYGPKMVELLLSKGANVNVKDNLGNTVLLEATNAHPITGNTKNIIEMLLNAGADPNAINKDGYSALSFIIQRFKQNEPVTNEIITMLLQKGANPNIGKINVGFLTTTQFTLLKYVREILGNENLANLLIEHKAKE